MIIWVIENIGSIVVFLTLSLIVSAIIKYLVDSKKKGINFCGQKCENCACGCSSCEKQCSNKPEVDSMLKAKL